MSETTRKTNENCATAITYAAERECVHDRGCACMCACVCVRLHLHMRACEFVLCLYMCSRLCSVMPAAIVGVRVCVCVCVCVCVHKGEVIKLINKP